MNRVMNYHDIETDSMLNGDGLRTVLWLAGCEHHCPGCQNPITWNPDGGKPFEKKEWLELYGYLNKDHISGLTLSGGDPLHENNVYNVYCLVVDVAHTYPNKTIWLYTGYTWEEIMDKSKTDTISIMRRAIMDFVDVLVDGRYIEELNDIKYHWAGSTNQRVIKAKESMRAGKLILHESELQDGISGYSTPCEN